MRPCSTSSRSARFTVMREMPNWVTSSFSEGRRSPARQMPSWILREMWSLTCSYSAMACAGVALRGAVAAVRREGRALMVGGSQSGSMQIRRHGFGADLFGEARLEVHELGAGLDRVMARVRQVHRQLGLDATGPGAEHGHAVGHEDGFVDVVGDEKHRLALGLPDAQQQLLHEHAGLVVERAEGLVHQQDLGVVGQRARNGGALLHAARQLLWKMLLEAAQADLG